MRTLTEKYNGVLRGLFSKDQFLRDARMEQSNLITQHNSYNDAVNILLNKGLISESAGAERFLDSLFDITNDELRVGHITQDEYEYILKQIDTKEYDLLAFGHDPNQVFDKLLMQAQAELGPVVSESAGAERFLDALFALANDELRVGHITQDEYEYILKQIETKEYDLLLHGSDPDQVFDKLLMQAEVELGKVDEGMTPEEYAEAEEAARLAKHPEKKKIEDIRAMLDKERFKHMKFDDPKLDQEYQEWYKDWEAYDGPESLEEGPARNNPKIEKLVAGINDLIAQAVDSDGDPVGVVDPTSTWEEPYVYEPIQYKNGHLKIVSKSPYQKTSDVDIILSRDMEFDGIPTLRLIMRMYKKAIKQAARMTSQDIEETSLNEKKATYCGRCGHTHVKGTPCPRPFKEGLSPYGDDAYIKSVEEKKLTAAEKRGKEKIVKSLVKGGMSKKNPMTYAIATTQAKELYEEEDNSVKAKYLEIVSYFNNVARSLDPKESYELHNMLKDYFNRMFEGGVNESELDGYLAADVVDDIVKLIGPEMVKGQVEDAPNRNYIYLKLTDKKFAGDVINLLKTKFGIDSKYDTTFGHMPSVSFPSNKVVREVVSEAPTTVERNDELEHVSPKGPTFTVSTFGKTRVSGPVTKAGTYKGKDYRVHDLIAIKPIEVGAVFKKLPAAKPEVKYANLAEAKEEGYQAPKAELPLDVLQHAIRFELEKKEVEGATKVYRYTEDEYLKAYKAAVKNLEKDLLHYKKQEGAVEGPSSKSDEMVKVKLKEGFKNIIRDILSENTSDKKAFNLNGKPL